MKEKGKTTGIKSWPKDDQPREKLLKNGERSLSSSELFKLPKIYFYDTGLMQMLWLKGLQKEIIGNVFETAIFA